MHQYLNTWNFQNLWASLCWQYFRYDYFGQILFDRVVATLKKSFGFSAHMYAIAIYYIATFLPLTVVYILTEIQLMFTYLIEIYMTQMAHRKGKQLFKFHETTNLKKRLFINRRREEFVWTTWTPLVLSLVKFNKQLPEVDETRSRKL